MAQLEYETYLAWLDEQPCHGCYEDNAHCVCRALTDADAEWSWPTDADLAEWERQPC